MVSVLFVLILVILLATIWFINQSGGGAAHEPFANTRSYDRQEGYYITAMLQRSAARYPLKDILNYGGCISLTYAQNKFRTGIPADEAPPFYHTNITHPLNDFPGLRTKILAALSRWAPVPIPGPVFILMSSQGPNAIASIWFPSIAPDDSFPGNNNIGFIGACHRWAWRYLSSPTYRESETVSGSVGSGVVGFGGEEATTAAFNDKCFHIDQTNLYSSLFYPIGVFFGKNDPENKAKSEYYTWSTINQSAPAIAALFAEKAAPGLRLNIIYNGMKITPNCVTPIISPSRNFTLTLDKTDGIVLLNGLCSGEGRDRDRIRQWSIDPAIYPGSYSELVFDDSKLQLFQGTNNVWSTPAPTDATLKAPFTIVLTDNGRLIIVDNKGAGADMTDVLTKGVGFNSGSTKTVRLTAEEAAAAAKATAAEKAAAEARAKALADARAAALERQLQFAILNSDSDVYTTVSEMAGSRC